MDDTVLATMFMLLFFFFPITISSHLNCNLYEGHWVYDHTFPLFDSAKCTSIREEFSCLKNGRPDHNFLRYRWQPKGCNLPRFDGVKLLMRLKGKKVLFVGDSVSANQWQSIVCLLKAAVGESGVVESSDNSTSTVTFQHYNVSISFFLSHYLVDIVKEKVGRALKLDSIKDGETWKRYDILIFNTWLWWYRRGPKQPWDIIENNGKMLKDMNRMEAFKTGLTTWARWVNTNVKPTTKVFFQGISPSHYNGTEWNEPRVTNCAKETTPLSGSTYPSGEPLASKVLKKVLNTQIKPATKVHLLDITTLSQLRKDGHPGIYNYHGMDCTHWCIAGVVDTWNQILYAQLVQTI